ncbi:Gfo/Idh/MocA family oxidoreductase [Streptomyces thermocarboxydus]|uniref:Gfo/Idh/MocA family protein n=1 Tax=Streptomyces TaxID=1883 RepID=UPI00167A7AAD|nr:Gfo/Idh/MocA family oxidoreductase [Streptomyces sp. AC04842]MDN3285625.1 Gfo/Idh/MocA family oxidoreductase [Streptomyces thermocarboxydus]GHE66331.1 oxidoreductase [Streptomyces cellulosae]
MSAPVSIGVLGCADIAVRRMLPAFTASPDVEVAAVASRDRGRAEKTAGRFGCRPVHGYEALLEADDVQAVYVPLPAALHAPWVEAALAAGKHVLAEKPLTTDPDTTAHLLNVATERGVALMENVMFVHHPRHEAVRRLVTDGRIGELRAFHAAFTIPPLADSDIRYDAGLGGGALADVGLYPLRAALHFLGPELEVIGARTVRGRGRQVETSGAALLGTPGGVTAHITFGMEHAYLSRYELWGSEGRITVDRAFTPPADFVPPVSLHTSAGTEEIRLTPADQVAATVAAFVTAVRAGYAPGEDTLRQAVLLDAVRRRSG